MNLKYGIWLQFLLLFVFTEMIRFGHDAFAQPPIIVSNSNSSIATKYKNGLISKDEAIQETLMEENKKSLDLYGLVVDQKGQPVANATVRGSVGLNVSMVQSGGKLYYAKTDSQGRFSFLNIHGAGIGIWPQKEGYFYDLKLPSQRPDNYQPAPDNPLVFTMWKIGDVEPITQIDLEARIPYDGNPTAFDFKTAKKTQAGPGDLQVTLWRSAQQASSGNTNLYDWSIKVEIPGGGILRETDPYPYRAPIDGYQPLFKKETTGVRWASGFRENFYFRNNQGQYGHLLIDLTAYAKKPDTVITVRAFP